VKVQERSEDNKSMKARRKGISAESGVTNGAGGEAGMADCRLVV